MTCRVRTDAATTPRPKGGPRCPTAQPIVQTPEMSQASAAPSDEAYGYERGDRLRPFLNTVLAVAMIASIATMMYTFTRLDNDLDRLEDRIDARLIRVDARFEKIDDRFTDLEEDIDARFEKVEAGFDAMDARMGRLETQIAVLSEFLGVPAPTP